MSLMQSFDTLKQRSVHATPTRPRTRATSAVLEIGNKENVDSPVGHKPTQREKSVMAIAEMRDKEVGFVEDMTALLLTFLKPIADATGKHKYVRLLAHQLGDILRVSQWLRDALAEELRSSVTLDNLPTILMEFSQKLAVFAPYCGNYLRYCHFFNRLATQNGRIAELIREANNQGEDFMSYLIKPVQHALRYHLHVENFCKALAAANPQDAALARLGECHRRLLEGGNAVNAAAGQMGEQQNALQAIEARFAPALPYPLIVPNRVLMQEVRGVTLTTVEGERARVDLFFFSDVVVCAVPNERGQLRLCFSWKLRDTWVAPGTPQFPTAIQIMKVMEMAPFLVEFADVNTRNAFLTWFRDALIETHLRTHKPTAYLKRSIIELSLDRDTGLYTALPRPPNFGQRISADQYHRQVQESASKAESVLKTPEAQKLRKQAQKKKIAPLENILSLFQKD